MSGRQVVFAHGKESGPWGTKIRYLADLAVAAGWSVESPDYSGLDDPGDRLEKLLARPRDVERLVLCGSSMGGYISAMACQRLQPHGLFLLAPALYLPGYPGEPTDCPAATVVVHGWRDDIVPPANAIRFAEPRGCALHLLNDGHRLVDSLDFIGRQFSELLRSLG